MLDRGGEGAERHQVLRADAPAGSGEHAQEVGPGRRVVEHAEGRDEVGDGAKTISSKPANSVFNDALRDGDGTSIYWTPGHPSDAAGNARYQAEWNSVNVPNTGTRISVKSISSTGMVVLDLNK